IRVCVPRVPHPPRSTLFPYTTLFRSALDLEADVALLEEHRRPVTAEERVAEPGLQTVPARRESARHVPHVLVVHQEEGAEVVGRSEEHTSELQSPDHLVCRLLLEKKK